MHLKMVKMEKYLFTKLHQQQLKTYLMHLKNFKKNISYELIGVRNGEKFHETLISKEEMFRAKNKGKFYIIPPEYKDINYSKYFFKGNTKSKIPDEYNSSNTEKIKSRSGN